MTRPDLHEVLGVRVEASAREVDAAYRAVGEPQALRYAWKVLRDRYFASMYRRFGDDRELMTRAGWFDDGVSAASVHAPEENLRCLTTPTHKLTEQMTRMPHAGPVVVLLSTGAFSPVHQGHIDLMLTARSELQRRGFHVAAGYVSPGHDDYVHGKYDGQAALDAAHRLALCAAAVQESDWLMVDPWEARYVGTAINYTDVTARLEAYLRLHVDRRVAVFYVAGSDNAGFARVFCDHGGFVCVKRDGRSFDDVASDPQVASCEQIVFAASNGASNDVSSSSVRSGEHAALQAAQDLCQRWELNWEDVKSRPVRTASAVTYMLRDDLQWATERWVTDSRSLDSALQQFGVSARQHLERAFADVRWPDRSRHVQVTLLDLEAQRRYVSALAEREEVLNLDVCTETGRRLDLSRRFAVSDGQRVSHRLAERPGRPGFAEQVRAVPPGTYTLLDDDIASGYTVDQVRSMLPVDVQVSRVASLLHEGPLPDHVHPVFDVVDLRDVMLGATDAGLVVELPDGTVGRALYALPYVSTVSRAKLPASSEWDWSLAVWEMNLTFFSTAGRELTVCNADPACATLLRYVGFGDDTLLQDVCAWHVRQLRRLPFRP